MPRGPEETAEEWFAPERLGFSAFACRTCDEGAEWVIVLSRIMEKTPRYALYCLDIVLSGLDGKKTLTP